MQLLLEILERTQWLAIQQALVDFGFDTKFIDENRLRFTGAYKDRNFAGIISYYNGKFTVGNAERPVRATPASGAVEDIIDTAAALFIDHVTMNADDNFDWLTDEQSTDLARLLLDGKVYEAIGVDPGVERMMIKHYESKGWTLFVNSEGEYSSAATGETMLIFVR